MLARLLTTILILPFILWPLIFTYTHIWEFMLACFVFLSTYELSAMLSVPGPDPTKKASNLPPESDLPLSVPRALWATAMGALFLVLCWSGLFLFTWTFALFFTLYTMGALYRRTSISHFIHHMLTLTFSLVLGILPWICVWQLYHLTPTGEHVLFLIAVVMGSDTGGYLSGKLWGKRPLALDLSPRKTWEGAYGALVFSLCISGVVYSVLHLQQHFSIFTWVLWSLLGSCASMTGDLFISAIKRYAHTKDTGSFLPGHGGFLDRGDGFIMAAPILWILHESHTLWHAVVTL